MGLHNTVFLLLSTFFTLLGLLCFISPATAIEQMMEPKIYASIAKTLPQVLWIVQTLGGAYFILASLLCTAAAKVTRQMCVSLAAGFAIPVLMRVYGEFTDPAVPRTVASYGVTVGIAATAVGLYVLSNSAADQHAIIRTKKNE